MISLPLTHFIFISNNRNALTVLTVDLDKAGIFFFSGGHMYWCYLIWQQTDGLLKVFRISGSGISPKMEFGYSKENKL